MASFNQITLVGNLTREPEVRQIQTQKGDTVNVTSFTIAVNRQNKNKEVDFFRINAWNKTGENCAKYLSKGKSALVTGELNLTTYAKKDGSGEGFSLDVHASQVTFLSPKNEDGGSEISVQPNIKSDPFGDDE